MDARGVASVGCCDPPLSVAARFGMSGRDRLVSARSAPTGEGCLLPQPQRPLRGLAWRVQTDRARAALVPWNRNS